MKYYIEKHIPSEKNNSNSSNRNCSINYMWVAWDTKWGVIFKLILILILRETELIIFLHYKYKLWFDIAVIFYLFSLIE